MFRCLRTPLFMTMLAAGLLAGCSDSSTSGGGSGASSHNSTGTVSIAHDGFAPEALQREDDRPLIPPGVDAMQLTFHDAAGNVVHGPVEVPVSTTVQVPGVPTTAREVEIDYLRNGGYCLYTDREALDWQGGAAYVSDPDPAAAAPPSSAWRAWMDDAGKAHLGVRVNGAAEAGFLVKGVAYSPAPIGYNTRQSTDLGDFFWDTPNKDWFLDWDGVWKRDLEKIREMGFNTVRVYSMIPYHLGTNGEVPDPDKIPSEGQFLYEHKKFLDACWNNGDRPIYVLVGVPTSDEIWYKHVYDLKDSDPNIGRIVKFWEAAWPEMVKQVGDHPAVLGFVMFNEKAFPQYFADGEPEAGHWWSQVKKFSEESKTKAPQKLVGWATNDDPTIPARSRGYLASHGGFLDFFGVNGYQPDQWNASLDPYLKSNLGNLARPVILTEFGMPGTGRDDKTMFQPYKEPALTQCKNVLAQRYGVSPSQVEIPGGTDTNLSFPTPESVRTIRDMGADAAGTAVGRSVPKAFEHLVCVGMTYFDWSDEYWKQESYIPFFIPGPNGSKKTVYYAELDPKLQEGGFPNPSFPNGTWDEEGFGLHSIALSGRTADQVYGVQPWNPGGNTRPDALTPRAALVQALLTAYQNAETSRAKAR